MQGTLARLLDLQGTLSIVYSMVTTENSGC